MNEKAMIERLLLSRAMSQHMTWNELFTELDRDRHEAAEMLRKVVAERDALRNELNELRNQAPVARLLEWIGPSDYQMPEQTARTFAEYGDDHVVPNRPDSYWRNGAPLYLAAGAHGAIENAAQGLIDDIDCLMSESEGVAGLHLNGDLAPWNELEPGGRFERLTHLDLLREVLATGAQGATDWSHLKQYGYAPGNYMCRCGKCGEVCYDMDKRAITCRSCAEVMHAGKSVPAGWQLVPQRVTPQMEAVYSNDSGAYQTAQALHDAMLAAAPKSEK